MFLFDYKIQAPLRFGLEIFRTPSKFQKQTERTQDPCQRSCRRRASPLVAIVDPFEISIVETEACADSRTIRVGQNNAPIEPGTHVHSSAGPSIEIWGLNGTIFISTPVKRVQILSGKASPAMTVRTQGVMDSLSNALQMGAPMIASPRG